MMLIPLKNELKKLLDNVGFTQTMVHHKKSSYATIIGVKA